MPQEQQGRRHQITDEIWACTLFMVQKHEMGNCEHWWWETVERVLFQCPRYQGQRFTLKEKLKTKKDTM